MRRRRSTRRKVCLGGFETRHREKAGEDHEQEEEASREFRDTKW